MNKTDDQIKSEIEDNESRAEWGAWAIVAGLVIEIVLAVGISLEMDKKGLENWGAVVADCLIVLGVYCEIHFGRKASAGNVELRRRSEEKVAEANVRAAEANRAAEEERHARLKLEAQLQARTLTPEEIEMLRGLRETFPEINVAREVDIETHLFAQQIAMALMSAGITVRQYRRAPDVHTAGIQIYDPLGFDDSGPRSVGPLLDVFKKIEPNVVGIAGPMPTDIPASPDLPMIIVGGRIALRGDDTVFTHLAQLLEARNPNSKPQTANIEKK
jgi:hypothetical protein